MSHNPQDVLDTILNRLKSLASSETIVGEPVNLGNVTILPVIKITVGFVAGGGEGNNSKDDRMKGSGGGGGGGGGASVSPVGFIVWDGEKVSFTSVGKGKIETLVESVPELLKKFGFSKKSEGKGSGDRKRHGKQDDNSGDDV